MHKIKIIAVGKLKEKFEIEAFEEFKKRLGAHCSLELVEIKEERLKDSPSENEIKRALDKEAEKIFEHLKGQRYMVLAAEGENVDGAQFAQFLKVKTDCGEPLIFIIGSSFGLSDKVKRQADKKISLSKLTFTHRFARIVLAEQLYRAFKFNSGGSYAK